MIGHTPKIMHRPSFSKLPSPRILTLSLLTLVCLGAPLRADDASPKLDSDQAPADSIWLDSLDLKNVQQSYGTPQKGMSAEHHPLTLGGVPYPHGVGTHSVGFMQIDLHGNATRFQSVVGIDDDEKGKGSVTFGVWVDGKKITETGVLHGGDAPQTLSVDLTGAKQLQLTVGDAGDGNKYDHADWAGAIITLVSGATPPPETVTVGHEPPRLKMLPPDPAPAIHGARIVGATPGRFFLFPVAATGTPPLTFAADHLPDGLQIDASTGVISGALKSAGTTQVNLTVHNSVGSAQRVLAIVGGDNKLALTPPMGWNSWNVWAREVDEGKVKDAANELISTGLVAHGYQFINIDDTWQGHRDKDGKIMPNSKFADMKALCDDLHGKGLKIGIYSSPGPSTCGGYAGSYKHEDQDAQTYADWGFDYLKYDLCSYGSAVAHNSQAVDIMKKPYQVMAAALAKVDRDIVYSLCQYGDAKVWEWGANPDIRGNCWRTGTDIDDVWTGTSSWGSNRGVYNILEKEVGHEKYAGPGHWNDPDMLMVGLVGFGHPHPTQLTPNEQIVHVSMWCLLSSPLLIGCDMTKLDPFTLAILTNDELLDIDQDPLGETAHQVCKNASESEVWARKLSDGTTAVGLLNSGPVPQTVTATWATLGLSGKQPVRDLWLHEDVGSFDDSYSVSVPPHGIAVLKIGTPSS